ncbi:peptidoglycan recognition protein-like [Periplaneta americana]|uniref:peptidoglycan recognition protein-like n=1 Tax=Periplaneta americana TaxID=6978 RepID=UPI0037E97683
MVFIYAAVLLSVFSCLGTAEEDACSKIVTRSQWGGRAPTFLEYMKFPVDYVIIQHTVTPRCNSMDLCVDRVVNMQADHMDNRKWRDIGFSFLVGGDGNVYEGRGWHQIGAHTRGYNSKSIGVALIGEFSDALPSRPQLEATKQLLKCGVQEGELSPDFKLLGHRQVSATKSPGLALYQEIQTWPEWVEQP